MDKKKRNKTSWTVAGQYLGLDLFFIYPKDELFLAISEIHNKRMREAAAKSLNRYCKYIEKFWEDFIKYD